MARHAMKIIIMKCSGALWYKDKIGKVFEVCALQGGMGCKKYLIKSGKIYKEILAEDCEII